MYGNLIHAIFADVDDKANSTNPSHSIPHHLFLTLPPFFSSLPPSPSLSLPQKGEVIVDQAHRGYNMADDSGGYRSVNPLFMKYTPTNGKFSGQLGYGYRYDIRWKISVFKIRFKCIILIYLSLLPLLSLLLILLLTLVCDLLLTSILSLLLLLFFHTDHLKPS